MTDTAAPLPASPPDVATMSQEQARAEISATREAVREQGEKHPYMDRLHPRHAATQDRMAELYARAHPGDLPTDEPGTSTVPVDADLVETPARPDGYQLEIAPQFVASEEDRAAVPVVQGWLHMAGVPQLDASRIVTAYNRSMADPNREDPAFVEARKAAARDGLRATWGDAFDANLDAAERAVPRLNAADPRVVPFLKNTGLAHDPHTIMALADAAKRNNW